MMLKKITIEKGILFLAAGFAAYNFGMVGGYIERTMFSIGGFLLGVVVNLTLAIAASRYGSLNGQKRIAQARAAFWVMLVISPLLVSPVVFYRLPETFLVIQHADVWWLNILASLPRLLWSLAWPVGADLAIVLAGAVSGKGLIALSEPSAMQSPKSANAGATHSAKVQLQSAKVQLQSAKSATHSDALARTYPRKCEHCATQIASPQAVGAHMKKHHPELCKPKSMAVGLFEKAVEKAEKQA